MTAAVDNTFLTLILNPGAKARPDPTTHQATPHLKEKLLGLLDELSENRRTLIVPCPVLAEVLCVATPSQVVLERLRQYTCIELYPFDQKSAIEVSDIIRCNSKEIREIRDDATKSWQHMKMDIQIVGVAKAYGASTLYTDDTTQARFATLAGLAVSHTWQLTLSDKYAQRTLEI